jgi:hypothetical protein
VRGYNCGKFLGNAVARVRALASFYKKQQFNTPDVMPTNCSKSVESFELGSLQVEEAASFASLAKFARSVSSGLHYATLVRHHHSVGVGLLSEVL